MTTPAALALGRSDDDCLAALERMMREELHFMAVVQDAKVARSAGGTSSSSTGSVRLGPVR
jgi:hypothetical protein